MKMRSVYTRYRSIDNCYVINVSLSSPFACTIAKVGHGILYNIRS